MDSYRMLPELGVEIGRGAEAAVYEIVGRSLDVVRVDLEVPSTRRPKAEATPAYINSLCFQALNAKGVDTVDACRFAWEFPHFLEMSRLSSESLMDWAARHPSRLRVAGEVLGRVHSQIHSVPAPRELPSAASLLPVRWGATKLVRLRGLFEVSSFPTNEDSPSGSEGFLLHGDMNPSNILRSPVSGTWIAIDWNGACRGPREADVASTLHQIRFGLAPQRWRRAPPLLLQFARLCLERAYLRAYEAGAEPLDQDLLERWLTLRRGLSYAEG